MGETGTGETRVGAAAGPEKAEPERTRKGNYLVPRSYHLPKRYPSRAVRKGPCSMRVNFGFEGSSDGPYVPLLFFRKGAPQFRNQLLATREVPFS